MNPSEILSLLGAQFDDSDGAGKTRVCETHTAFVFLVGGSAFKIKKPIRLPYLDFTTAEKRRLILEEELRINRELAGNVYRRVLPIRRQDSGSLTLTGRGEPVEWMLEMARLPDGDMLDQRLANRNVLPREIEVLGNRLCEFYRKTDRRQDGANVYLNHLRQETVINREHLLSMRSYLRPDLSLANLQYASDLIEWHAQEITDRGAANLIVDGHGDLRLEHICLTNPPVLFDRLEFNEDMRQIDIYDEINYLALETKLAGHGWIGHDLMHLIDRQFEAPPSAGLLQAYGLFRLFLRARLAIDHLLDPFPRNAEKWVRQAKTCLSRAGELAAASCEV